MTISEGHMPIGANQQGGSDSQIKEMQAKAKGSYFQGLLYFPCVVYFDTSPAYLSRCIAAPWWILNGREPVLASSSTSHDEMDERIGVKVSDDELEFTYRLMRRLASMP